MDAFISPIRCKMVLKVNEVSILGSWFLVLGSWFGWKLRSDRNYDKFPSFL